MLARSRIQVIRERRPDGRLGGEHVPTAVLIAHVAPPIHGQAVMASALVEQAAGWSHVRLDTVNAVYSRNRESLVAFSVRKALLTLRYLRSAVAHVRRSRAELVIVTPAFYPGPFVKDATMICALKALTRTRVVAWVHMDPARLELERKSWLYQRLARYAIRRVDVWIACASPLAEQWPSFIPRERRLAVTSGIAGAPRMTRRDESASYPTRICFISSLDSSKGWTDLLEAADDVCASHPEAEFHFYGDVGVGWTEKDVAYRFRTCRFGERIVWHGPVRGTHKWSAFESADLFCLPSRTEQFPVVVLEAMASGLAVVATHVGAVAEAVVEGQGGWLVEPGSPEQLTQALEEALADRERLRRFGQFNAERQQRKFSIGRFGRDWEQLLKSMASS